MSGSGIGTPISPIILLPTTATLSNYPIFPNSFLPLVKYAKYIGYSELAFFGFSVEPNDRTACREVWTRDQRDDIEYFLRESEDEIEEVIQYPLKPTWFSDEPHPFKRIVIAKWGKVIASGIRAVEIISDDAVVDYAQDPNIAYVSISVDYGLKSLYELHVFYPDTDIEITPSDITYDDATTTLTISIPRTRLLEYSKLDNPMEGYLYSDPNNFQPLVDVHRIYNDTSVQGKLIYRSDVCSSFCVESYDSVCQYLKDSEVGTFYLEYPNYVCCSKNYESVKINYEAGLQFPTRMTEMTVIRLAHSKMPDQPCGCEQVHRLWMKDRNIPTYQTRDRLDCPFGLSDGAWNAWKWACGMELKRASALI